MKIKLGNEREEQIGLRFFKVGCVTVLLIAGPMLLTVGMIQDVFFGVDYLLVIILWAMVCIMGAGHYFEWFFKHLLKLYDVEVGSDETDC